MHSASETATRVADQTRYAGRSAADYVRMHPVQMALLAGGITWWLLRGRDRSDDWEGASEGWQDRHPLEADSALREERSLREKAGEYVSSARETVGEYASSARETVGEYASSASIRARQTWERTSTTVDDFVHDYPLAAGAVAVAVGAAIGLAVPGSRFEDRTLGERRDQAIERARAKALELKNTVTQKAKNVANAVEELTAPTTSGTTPQSTTTSSTTGSV